MSLEFSTVTLGDIVSLVIDYRGKTPKKLGSDWSEKGIRTLSAKNIKTGNIIREDTIRYVDEELYKKWMKDEIKRNDIIITSEAPFGEVFFWNSDEKIVLSQRLFGVRCNPEIVDPKFIYFYMTSDEFQWELQSRATGTTVKGLRQPELLKCEIKLPNFTIQKKISYLLSNIEDKIDCLKELNKNLEDTILKIFDSWFVKFELSNEFSDSKLGLIPKGWKIDYLGSKNSCSIIRSGIDEFDNSKIYVATADVDNSIITSNDTLITTNDKPSRANMQPIAKSIWFAKMIDSRKLIMIDDYCSDLLNNYIFSTGFCGLKCVDKYFYYLWAFLLTDAFDVMKNNFCTGTTMQAINNKDTKLIEFVLPDDNIINQFNVIAKPMFKKIYYNSLEIKKLQRLIDTLLPKLMSGEIDVSKINCDLELKYNYMKYLFNQIHTPMFKSVV